ncbi:MAG: hypothetical protein FJ104_14615, partial [Deltaproteobacteria bacterium]|nr:hypothetical protein [Deltaproteobacteria bacterium]
GGACWDYENCSPDGGLRGAANPNGISPGTQHMTARNGAFPVLRKTLDDNPLRDWNIIYVPYCTGDLHTGNRDAEYTGPNGEKLTYRHRGHDNVMKIIEYVKQNFQDIPQLLVDGCSAGGAAALVNYHFIRDGLGAQAQCGYLLSDSGPIFPNTGFSKPVHDKIREAWNVDPILESLDGQFSGVSVDDIKADFGRINTALADKYPKDRFTSVLYRWDLNYSVYSYGPFYGFPDAAETHRMWEKDISLLTELYDTRDNLAYFIPNWRVDNCSHCLTIPAAGLDLSDTVKALTTPWMDSDLQSDGKDVTLQDYVRMLLDDQTPLQSYFEDPPPAADGFTSEQEDRCMHL